MQQTAAAYLSTTFLNSVNILRWNRRSWLSSSGALVSSLSRMYLKLDRMSPLSLCLLLFFQ
jgi:hypothetical protein